MSEPCFECHAPAHKRPCSCDHTAEIARLQAEVAELKEMVRLHARSNVLLDKNLEEAIEANDTAWNDAIEAAAKIADDEAARILSKQDGREPGVDQNLRFMALMLPEVATAIRALAKLQAMTGETE